MCRGAFWVTSKKLGIFNWQSIQGDLIYMILKKKHVRAGSIFIGLSFILVGPFFDLFRGKPLEMGFIQQSLIIVGLAVLLFGFLLDKQYSSLKAEGVRFHV